MAHSLSKIIVHTVFSTRERRPFLLDESLRKSLHGCLFEILGNMECVPFVVGGVEDHVHALSILGRTITAAILVKELKRRSALWLKSTQPGMTHFAWQEGYGMFSVSYSHLEVVKEYIEGQEKHHRKISFQDEFRTLLKRYDIHAEEKYLWD
jgi:putative transposase